MKQYLLFDLDGTLTDPMVGITSSVQYALEKFGVRVRYLKELIPFIGPPLAESFQKFYGFSKEDAERAIQYYREYYAPKGIFENEVYENIISNEVLEHVFNPDEFLSEINRVLKMNGNLLLTVPFVWDEHEQPYDFARYTSFAMKHLFDKYGFKIVEYKKSCNDLGVIFQLLNDYIYKKLIGRSKLHNLLLVNFLCSIFNILGILLIKITPKNDDLYLDNIILAKKVKNI